MIYLTKWKKISFKSGQLFVNPIYVIIHSLNTKQSLIHYQIPDHLATKNIPKYVLPYLDNEYGKNKNNSLSFHINCKFYQYNYTIQGGFSFRI